MILATKRGEDFNIGSYLKIGRGMKALLGRLKVFADGNVNTMAVTYRR